MSFNTVFMRIGRCMLAASVMLALDAQAHRAWIVPSSTVLAGESPWVTFDAAISNSLFYADHAAMRLDGISAIRPDVLHAAIFL